MKTIMKTGLLAFAIMSAFATTSNAQPVTGSGSGGIFAGNIPRWNASSNLTNSLIWDDGSTVILGTVKSTPWNYMLINQNGPSGSYSTGLNVELFNMNASGTVQAAAFNIQGNQTNIGLNSYAAEGTNSYGATLLAQNSTGSNYGIKAQGKNGAITYGGYFTADNGTSENSAVYAYAKNTNNGKSYGVETIGEGKGDSQPVAGIYTQGWDNSSTSDCFGIYAKVHGGKSTSSFAGYFTAESSLGISTNNVAFFNGYFYGTGNPFTISDIKFKKNIQNLDNSIETIMQLSPKTYTFKDKSEFPSFNFPSEKQYGLIAQEVEKIIPDMVHEAANPAMYDNDGNLIAKEVPFKSVNYIALVPILVAGMQEQQATIELQNEKINNLEEQIKKIQASTTGIGSTSSSTGAELYQNNPNPFNGYTTISYLLPNSYSQANIMIFDMNGKKIKNVALHENGKGSISISANELSAGMYLYSLMVDGEEIATKRMILSNN